MSRGDTSHRPAVLVVDFGAHAQLIARRVRECHVFSEIVPHDITADDLATRRPAALVSSGWTEVGAPGRRPRRRERALPSSVCPSSASVTACRLMARPLGRPGREKRRGARIWSGPSCASTKPTCVFSGFTKGETLQVWMSHGDRIASLPTGFRASSCTSDNTPLCAIAERHPSRRIYGMQFHPEVVHTPRGKEILANFVHRICGCGSDWTMGSFIEQTCDAIRAQVGEDKVILGLSGGVDSSVAAALLHKAIGDQLTCIFVDNGLVAQRRARRPWKLFGGTSHQAASRRCVEALSHELKASPTRRKSARSSATNSSRSSSRRAE